MPSEEVKINNTQGRIFEERLSDSLNPKHKLYKLRSIVDWCCLDARIFGKVSAKRYGRSRKDRRVMLGLFMLQAISSASDCYTEEELQENSYWQYFCGYDYFKNDIIVSESCIRRFRQALGESGCREILKELVRIGCKIGIVKKKDLAAVIIDTTVQPKHIKHPHDCHLMEKARFQIVKLCKDLGISLNDTYAKYYKRGIMKVWKYRDDSKSKKRTNQMKKLKSRLGGLIRLCHRGIAKLSLTISPEAAAILEKANMIYNQSVLCKRAKED